MTDANERIRLALPFTDAAEVGAVAAVLASGTLTQGSRVAAFEEAVAKLVGARHGIATTSATTALHLVLAGLDIGPDDEVLVPDFTFPATANVVVERGARPVLVDIDLATYTLDPAAAERLISPRTRAIMPVHTFGLSADMDPILALAKRHGLAVVEDAACALATTYRGRPVGSLGSPACFSFHPRKSITTGEGGMVTTDDPELAERLRLLRSHGGVRREGRFTFEAAGYNYRLSDILAAIGLAQLGKLDWILERRRSIAQRYRDLLADVPAIGLPVEPDWGGHIYQSFVVLLDRSVDRDAVIRALDGEGIESTLGTYALHCQPFFQRAYGYRPGDLPASREAFERTLTLPLYPTMEPSVPERVAGALRRAVESLSGTAPPAASARGS
jgi:dTDP-4-amino-4,6-dideoxygalactose transaminase